jgi:hypothetical protein
MAYFIFREVECLDITSYMEAMPLVAQVQKMWNAKNPQFISTIMSPIVSGHPIRIRWMLQAESLDAAQAANAELLKDKNYIETSKALAALVDNSTWYDEAWRELKFK